MKQFIIFFTFIVAIFVTAQLAIACPAGYSGPYPGTIIYNGCTVNYTFCIYYDGSFHYVAIESVQIAKPCDPSSFSVALRDEIIKDIAQNPFVLAWAGYTEIPPCPNGFCLLTFQDRICFEEWIFNPQTNFWEMSNICGTFGSCSKLVYVCWVLDSNGNKVLNVIREGYETGPECPSGCNSNCD